MTTINTDENGLTRIDAFGQILGQLEAARQKAGRGRVLGIAGCRSGDGATFVLGKLGRRLAAKSRRGVLLADATDLLAASRLMPSELLAQCSFTEEAGLWLLSSPDENSIFRPMVVGPEPDLQGAITVLASRFDYIMLDCGAVNVSGRMWEVAPIIDDVLLVVAAGETKRSQITYARRIIAQSGTRLSGCILNKRTYPLPAGIHRFLS